MPSEDRRYIDPEVEKFFRDNQEMISKLLREERLMAMEAFEKNRASFDEFVDYHKQTAKAAAKAEKEMVDEFAEYQRRKAKEAVGGVVKMVTDPDVQKHFFSAGLEMIMMVDALFKAAPIPDYMRDAAGKTKDATEAAGKAYREKTEDGSKKEKVSVEKIHIGGNDESEKVGE